jgi:hypothetical protein
MKAAIAQRDVTPKHLPNGQTFNADGRWIQSQRILEDQTDSISIVIGIIRRI